MRNLRFRTIKTITITLLLMFTFTATTPLSSAVDWSSDTQLIFVPEAWDEMPSVMQASDETIWVVWASDREGFQNEIFYTTSSDNGVSWSDDTRLTTSPGTDEMPSVMQASDETIWVVWSSYRTGDFEVFYKTSSDNGVYWSGDTRLTNYTGRDVDPHITQLMDGRIWVIWHRDVEGNFDLFYTTSSDNGVSWSDEDQLTTNPSWDLSPSITQTWDGMIWVVWSSYRTGDFEVFYKTSSDNGVYWSGDTQLTFDTQKFDQTPSVIQAADGSIWVVWSSGSDKKTDDVYYMTSLDYGATWSESIQLTSDAKDDTGPSIVNIYPRRTWVVWASYRTDDFEIFYKISDEIPIHDVAVTSVAPQATSIFRNEIVPISVVVENQGTEDENLEVSCYANSTLIGTQTVSLTNGTSTTLDFFWSTEDSAFGTYIISATASTVSGETVANSADNTFVDGEVHVKLLGDVNGDGSVDASDLLDLSKAYGSEPGDPNWDPDCDFNWDNKVDASDLFDLSKNYGKTA